MKFSRTDADIFVSDSGPSAGLTPAAALARTTHLCVIAHQDDIEINAYPAVAECYGRTDRFFTGVVITNGAGSAIGHSLAGRDLGCGDEFVFLWKQNEAGVLSLEVQ